MKYRKYALATVHISCNESRDCEQTSIENNSLKKLNKHAYEKIQKHFEFIPH